MFKVTLNTYAKNGLQEMKNNHPEAILECKNLILGLCKSNYGIPLENKLGMDYRGYYKLYCFERTYRIIYKLISENEIKVMAIGLRKNLKVYEDLYNYLEES
jgi:mRNA-degrading endonuclease RelE of RelBE toxin-antitoxin system